MPGPEQAFIAIASVLHSPTDIDPKSEDQCPHASLPLKVSLPGTRPLPVYGYTYINVIKKKRDHTFTELCIFRLTNTARCVRGSVLHGADAT